MRALCVVRRAAPARSALLFHQPRDLWSLSLVSRARRPTTDVRLSPCYLQSPQDPAKDQRNHPQDSSTPVRHVDAHIVRGWKHPGFPKDGDCSLAVDIRTGLK